MSIKSKKEQKEIVERNMVINKERKKQEKDKENRIEGLDKGFITKWLM